MIRGGNLSQDIGKRLDDVGLVFVDEVLAKEFSRSVAVEGDLVFTCWGTINQVGLIDERASFPRYIVSNKQMKLTVDQDKALPLFLYYFFSSPLGQHQIEMNAIGSSVPGFNLSKLRSIPVPLPPLRVQKQIVALLGSLDDKIELNRRMNETLEAMAQVIFRDWFVDFGPTRRKLEGATDPLTIMGGLVQDSERAQALADLFPAALGDDGLPEGWTFGRLEDVLELAYGKALPKGERRDGTIPVYGSGGVGGFHDTALVSGPSVIVGRKGTVGSLYWEDDDFYPIDTVFYVKSKLPMTYCYQLLQTLGLETMNTDAAVPGLNRNNAYRLEVPQPYNSKLLSEFGEIADVLRSKITANVRENRTLAATRDLLLPKLMSGEVRLSAASEAVT
ncbi:type I restriction enzyme, S subunit [Rhizobium sp. RU36D]|nr:type I restriction enzyme, S subunit [Rhizobium sp. RU36D]